jgi:membrane protease YdiL (CAAX protease family)
LPQAGIYATNESSARGRIYHRCRLADSFLQFRFNGDNGDNGDLSIITGDDIARFMQHLGDRSARLGRSPLTFFVLVFALAVPFVVFGALTGLLLLPGLPVAALMFVCPGIAALILTYREDGSAGAKALLNRALDYKRISPKRTHLAYSALRGGVVIWRNSITFFVAALGEELGWSGYVIDPLQNRWGALKASFFLGSIWALFHYAALLEVHRSIAWIAWWRSAPSRRASSWSGFTTTPAKA